VAFDEQLAERVRATVADRRDVAERRMFGGLTFLVGGHMCCGVQADELIVRLGPDGAAQALARRHVRPMDFTGRPLAGFVTVDHQGLSGPALNRWVAQAVKWAESLPPKPPPRAAERSRATRARRTTK